MKNQRYQREARELAESQWWAWTRHERRRLARADAAPGRRFARRMPKAKPITNAFSRSDVETIALMAVPGLRRRDVQVRTPRLGVALVELSGPRADAYAVEAVRAALEDRTPVGIALNVVAVGGRVMSSFEDIETRNARRHRARNDRADWHWLTMTSAQHLVAFGRDARDAFNLHVLQASAEHAPLRLSRTALPMLGPWALATFKLATPDVRNREVCGV